MGRCSFDIMALHFTVFKLMDYAYARFFLPELPETLSSFPVSFRPQLGPFYVILGLLLPALAGRSVSFFTRRLLKRA